MSYTTNTATAESPMTYSILARECERLAAIARKLETLAAEDGFRDRPEFRRLRDELRTASLAFHSLEAAI